MFHEAISAKAPLTLRLALHSYFLKGEKFNPSSKDPRVNPANHGTFGPRKTGFPSETAVSAVVRFSICLVLTSIQPINDFVIESCRELGMRNIE